MTLRASILISMVKDAWRKSGVSPRSGATEASIQAFEQSYGIRLPADIAEYFRSTDGMDEDDVDEHTIRFWRLSEMRPVLEELPGANADLFGGYFVFADYSLWAHGYAVHLNDSTDVIVVGGERPITVAASFGDFLELYVKQPIKLFPHSMKAGSPRGPR
jgi:hypothetical protein